MTACRTERASTELTVTIENGRLHQRNDGPQDPRHSNPIEERGFWLRSGISLQAVNFKSQLTQVFAFSFYFQSFFTVGLLI
ncbi:hypothetical protein K2173_011674 [Erythroxylum novogranatense]|uniref:Uncharacterized protein n=1 Tax=Erythroxylum novogranatense TaxID=1862640 RepID=A0AAV8T0R7_9ROSI|nr:hypothetical protein K2173_011674 [Erythroxylum novogranatense]